MIVDDVECNCLCSMHRRTDPDVECGISEPGEQHIVRLVGGVISPKDVQMCAACASWWRTQRPERVAA